MGRQEGSRIEDMDFFEKLMVFGVAIDGGMSGRGKTGGERMAEWKDITMELLLRTVNLLDSQTVIRAFGCVVDEGRLLLLALLISPFHVSSGSISHACSALEKPGLATQPSVVRS